VNEGLFGIAYGAVLKAFRQRVKSGQGASQQYSECVVLGTTDTTSPMSRSTGAGAPAADVCDLVLQVPYAIGRYGQAVTASGALSLQIPDGKITGGNRRGNGAVDLQTSRTAATQVASGPFAVVLGVDNTASGGSLVTRVAAVSIGSGNNNAGSNSSLAIGVGNTLSNNSPAAFGGSNTVSCFEGLAIGFSNAVSGGGGAVGIGRSNTSSGSASVAVGISCTANASVAFSCGANSTARGIVSSYQWAGGQRTAVGDRQFRRLPHCATTSNATATVLTTDGAAESTSNTWVIPANYSGILHGFVVARNTANNDTIGWEVKAMVTRDSTAASVAILGSASVAAVGTADAAMSSCSLAVGANTTNGSITLTATGIAATTIAWSGYIHCIENG